MGCAPLTSAGDLLRFAGVETPLVPAGWLPDPSDGTRLRWWDGMRWTEQVAVRIPVASHRPPAPPHPTAPVRVAVGALATTVVSLIASRFLIRWLATYQWPIAVYALLSAVVGYGPVVAYAVRVSRRWGTGRLRDDTGAHVRWVDAGWGPVTWIAAFGTQLALGVVVYVTGIPVTSNTEGVGELRADRGYVISLLVVAVLVAPIVEEIVFRGLVLRGFLRVMPVLPAVLLQAVLFGAAHVDPVRGVGNIGLVLILAGTGGILGGAAYLFRRVGPTMIAHAILNAVVLVIVLVRS